MSKDSENIKCIVRCRPLNEKEKGLGTKCITISPDSKVVIVESKTDKLLSGKYIMDRVFSEDVTQEEIFREIGEPIIQSFLSGYNCTIFCYGQTGAGKTHTMMGPLDQLYETNSPQHGLIPRIINYIFNDKQKVNNIITGGNADKCKNIRINSKICVMELYQESIIDLLCENQVKEKNDKNELKIKEDPKKGMYVMGITEKEIYNAKGAKDYILMGLKSRHVAATEMNAESSRSHLLFSIYVSTSYINPKGGAVSKSSRLHLIDLAGSERQKKTKAQGERIKEACMINKSLSTLGNVINALVENYDGKNKYIPFRDSKLTYFLKDSLGGNSKTTIVANISCSLIQMNETISTLKFVTRAKMIKNSATLNMTEQENIEALQEEIKKLKAIIAKGGTSLEGGEGSKVNENYICPICHNEPIEVNQEKLMQTYKNEINKLMDLIIKNFKCEENVKKQFLNLNKEIIASGVQFYSSVEKYKNEYDNKIKELQELINLFKKFYDGAKENMNKANEKVINFKIGDAMDRITFGKINELNMQATEIIEKLNSYDLSKYKKLETEIASLKEEKKVSDEVKKLLDQKNRMEIEQKDINPNSKNIIESVNQFINSNDKIIKFFADNFLQKPNIKDELVLLEKTKYEMLLFQIDEGKMNERSLKKEIEQMETDNYLVNIDLLRMKNQLDAYKLNSKNFKKDDKNKDEKEEKDEKNDKKDKDDKKDEGDKKDKDDKNDLNKSKDSIKSKGSKKSKKEDGKKPIFENSEDSNDDNDDIDDNIMPMQQNKIKRKSIMRVGTVDPSIKAMEQTKNFTQKYGVNLDNLEIVKMKERLDELNDDLSDKITENQELKQHIYDLDNKIEELNLKLQENENTIKELNQDIEALDTTNDAFEKQIQDLTNYKKDMMNEINEIMNMNKEKENKINELNEIFNKISEIYQKKCEELLNKNKELIVQIENLKKRDEMNNKEIDEIIKVIGDNDNNINSLYNNINDMVNNIIKKLQSKVNTINQLNNEKQNLLTEKDDINNTNKNKINLLQDDINNYKNKIISKDKIIHAHEEQELLIVDEIDNVTKLIEQNNSNINKLKELYDQDLSSMIQYYKDTVLPKKNIIANTLNENDITIGEVKELLKNNSNNLEDMFTKYNQLNNQYFDKCCQLLNAVNKNETKNKLLTEKIKNYEVNENNLNQKIAFLEKENDNLKNETKNIKESRSSNIEDNNKLKKDLEKSNSQITSLNQELIKYVEQLKEKDNLLEELRKEQSKISMQIKELEFKNNSLDKNMSDKNEIINQLQTDRNKQNQIIDELTNKNLTLIKEMEEEKNNHSLFKEQNSESANKITELNDKIIMLFNEISNKDKTINQLNNDHNDLSKKLGEIINDKNESLNKLDEKEKEISALQQNINELNNKFLYNNQQINTLVNDSQNKLNEIDALKQNAQESQKEMNEKNNLIQKLNNKVKILEDINKKSMKNNGVNPTINDDKNLNGLVEVSSTENYLNNNGNECIISLLKSKNEKLIKEKVDKDNEFNKLNMKYAVTEVLSNLFLQLVNEFSQYQSKAKDKKDSILLNETFIKEKINLCNNEKKILENNINSKMNNKKTIINDLYSNISEYMKQYNTEINTFINNLNNLIIILEEDDKEIDLPKISNELIEDINQLTMNNIPSNDGYKELIELLDFVNKIIQYKLEIINNIFKIVDESYSGTIITEEINCDENILYYQAKYNNNANNKNKKAGNQNENEIFLKAWSDFKDLITNSKNQYKEILNKYSIYKKNLCNNKNILEQNNLYIKNINENTPNSSNGMENGENTDEIKLILNRIQNNKVILYSIINHYNDNINNNKYNISYKQCYNSFPNVSQMKKAIESSTNSKDEIDQKINEMKINYLLLKNLPTNYELYKRYLSQSILERKNKILEDKMRLIFGENFNFNNIYNPDMKPEVVWDQNEIPKYIQEIMILKENKSSLESDVNALNLAFTLAMNGKPTINDSQLIILFRIKEENKLLKKEIKKIKEKNIALQERIKKICDDNLNDKSKKDDIYDNDFIIENKNINDNDINLKGNNYNHILDDNSISEIKESNANNNTKSNMNSNINSNLSSNLNTNRPNMKQKNNNNNNNSDYSKDNSSFINDINNGFTQQKTRRKNNSNDK